MREKCGEERKDKEKMTETMANLTPDDKDNQRRTIKHEYSSNTNYFYRYFYRDIRPGLIWSVGNGEHIM